MGIANTYLDIQRYFPMICGNLLVNAYGICCYPVFVEVVPVLCGVEHLIQKKHLHTILNTVFRESSVSGTSQKLKGKISPNFIIIV